MSIIVRNFIIRHQLIEYYYDSIKYKKFFEFNPYYNYDSQEYKKIILNNKINTYPYLVLEINFINNYGKEEFYEFKILFTSSISNLTNSLTDSILLNIPEDTTLVNFIKNIHYKIIMNICNWNVYASK